jgi:hypothetical protein
MVEPERIDAAVAEIYLGSQQSANALPELHGQRPVGGNSFDPMCSTPEPAEHPGGVGSGVERSSRPSNYGAGEGIRTLDVNLGKVALYH